MREYHIGYSLKEIFQKMELWEIIFLVWNYFDKIMSEKKSYEEARTNKKIEDGKMEMVFKKPRKRK